MNSLERDVRGAAAAHARLLAELADVTDEQVLLPSLLPAWTVGHVLAHIARNADSHVLMLEAAARGEVGAQYPGGLAQRAAEIEAGAQRSAAEHIADIAAAADRLERAWAATDQTAWAGEGSAPFGPVAIADLPFRRWREVVVHHADLGLSFTWRHWPADYVRLELGRMGMLWASRKPMGLTALPAAALELPDHERVAWLLGRTTVEGLAPAGIF